MRYAVRVASASALAAVTLAGCTHTPATVAPEPSTSPASASTSAPPSPTPSSGISRLDGGVVRALGAAVYIPPGALSVDADVAIAQADGTSTAVGGLADLLGPALSIRLGGAHLSPPVPVSLSIPAGDRTSQESMFLAYVRPGGRVVPVPAVVGAGGGSLTANMALPATVGLFRWNANRLSAAIQSALAQQRTASRTLACPTLKATARPTGLVVRMINWGGTGERMCPVQPRAHGALSVTFVSQGGVAVDITSNGTSPRPTSPVQRQPILDLVGHAVTSGGLGIVHLLPPGGSLTLHLRAGDYVDTATDRTAGITDALMTATDADPELTNARQPFLDCLFDVDEGATTLPEVSTCARRTLPHALASTIARALAQPAVAASLAQTYRGVRSYQDGILTQLSERDGAAPILGVPFSPYETGYGEVRPVTIDGAGDPGSIFWDARWVSWGGDRAVGYGKANYLPPGAQFMYQSIPGAAEVVAFDRGMCAGHLAYRMLEWFLPGQGEHFNAGDGFSICDTS